MSSNDSPIDPVDEGSPRGMNRRQMIKAAGIAGAAAWTAPVILDSLSSPAAAATIATGCYKFSYRWDHGNSSTSTCGWVTSSGCAPAITGGGCTPTGSFNPAGPAISFSSCNYNGFNAASSTLNVADNCNIVGVRWFNDTGSTCSGALTTISPTHSTASGSVTSGDGDDLRVVFVVSCS